MGAIAGGWQTNWVMSRTSGTPFTVASAGTSVNAPANTQTADQVTPTVAILGGHGLGQPYFDPMAFAPVTAVRFGNTGRDILRGPGVFNLDGSLFRTFRMNERFSLQFRAEAFGFTNTPSFSNPGATVSGATRNADGTIRAFNGYTEITSASGARQGRFALEAIVLDLRRLPDSAPRSPSASARDRLRPSGSTPDGTAPPRSAVRDGARP